MGFFSGSKKTKKVYTTSLLATKVFDDDLLVKTRQRLILEYSKKD